MYTEKLYFYKNEIHWFTFIKQKLQIENNDQSEIPVDILY